MNNLFVKRINLSNFRNYDALRLELDGRSVVLTGSNGAGKTNLLEALSLLVPGRGLRGDKLEELQNKTLKSSTNWAVSSVISNKDGEFNIGTGYNSIKRKRLIKIDGETIRSQAKLGEYVQALWLTPQMDRLFLDSSYSRRKFLDRLIFSFDPSHIGRINRYEKNMRERLFILKTNKNPNDKWLSSIEAIMSETAIAIAASRIYMIEKLQSSINEYLKTDKNFLTPKINVDGFLENNLKEKPALEVEDIFQSKLKDNRNEDARRERTEFGVHRTDFKVANQKNGIDSSFCSTGEQKSMLISIILSQAWLVKGENGCAPILLLDEVVAHLDKSRRSSLFERIFDLESQVFMTGTDESSFKEIKDRTQSFNISDGLLT